jgi:hypothetical protein
LAKIGINGNSLIIIIIIIIIYRWTTELRTKFRKVGKILQWEPRSGKTVHCCIKLAFVMTGHGFAINFTNDFFNSIYKY